MLQLKSFDHITIIVSDLDETRRFYVQLLGLDEVERPPFDFPGAWFQVGGTQIHATLTSDKAGIAGLGDLGAGSPSRGHHFAFEVESLSATIQYLATHEVAVVAGPKLRADGAAQVYVADPDGHVIELFEQIRRTNSP